MYAVMASLMSGGWTLDNDLDFASDYELAMEKAEQEHPEEFRISWEPCKSCSVIPASETSVEADELPC